MSEIGFLHQAVYRSCSIRKVWQRR